jgi:hypothetical protein
MYKAACNEKSSVHPQVGRTLDDNQSSDLQSSDKNNRIIMIDETIVTRPPLIVFVKKSSFIFG